MSIAIKWGFTTGYEFSQGFIYFDAVTSFEESLTGAVSSHPIDGGGTITDHFTRENPRFSMSAVISGVDISYHGRVVEDDVGNQALNSSSSPDAVKINSKSNSLLKFIPDTVGQFFTPSKPMIVMAVQPPETIQQVKETLEGYFLNPSSIQLFEYDLGYLKLKPKDNLIMTSISFKEDAESGDGLYCDISFEQVTFTDTQTTQVPLGISKALVSEEIADKAAATNNKGTQDSTTTPRSTAAGIVDSGTSFVKVIEGKFE